MSIIPTTTVREMLESSRFELERVETSSLAAMEADLSQRLATGERWEFAVVEASEDHIPGQSRPVRRGGMVLLRKVAASKYAGLYYIEADCGVESGATRSTATMLCLLLGYQDVEQFYNDFLRFYPKVIAWDLDTDHPQFEPAGN